MAKEVEENGKSATAKSDVTPAQRRVAIIGVHGVAHHDPGSTANAMADLLLSLPPYDPREKDTHGNVRACGEVNLPREFEFFTSTAIHVPLQPICIDKGKRVEATYRKPKLKFHKDPFFKFLQEGSSEFARAISPSDDPAKGARLASEPGAVGLQFTAKLLQDYRGGATGNAYVTTRLESRRIRDNTEVHIYEMFWADLARPASSLVSFFLALFQLILHLPSLSRLAIDTRPGADWRWKVFQFLHRYASRVLQIFIPLLKVILLAVLFAAIPAVTTAKNLRLLSGIIVAVIVAVFGFILMNGSRRPPFRNWISWVLTSFLVASIAAGLVLASVYVGTWNEIVVLSVACWVLGFALVWYAVNAYQDVRAGIVAVGWGSYIAASLLFALFASLAWRLKGHEPAIWLQIASLWTAQWIVVTLRVLWLIFAFFAISSSLLGAFVWRSERSASEREKARAAVKTSRFALALPAFLFVFITSFIWAGMFSVAQAISMPFFNPAIVSEEPPSAHALQTFPFDLFPGKRVAAGFPPTCAHNLATCSDAEKVCDKCAVVVTEDYLKGVLAWSLGYGSYIVVLLTAAGLGILVWWALPSVLTEKFPLRRAYDPGNAHERNQTEPPRDSTNREAAWMGNWISRGLDSLSLVTFLIWIAIFLVPLVFIYVGSLPFNIHIGLRQYSEHITKLIVSRAIAVAGTVAVLTAVVRYSSPILRVILDVDTYLRTGPKRATPRAKIFERYVSLLRHVAQFRGSDNRGYDEVVIVAHSLGSLISADLLRFLNNPETQTYDEQLAPFGFAPATEERRCKIPIKLFTMGNPLRQLLNRFFPYLYDWVRENPDNRLVFSNLSDPAQIKRLHDQEIRSLPDPRELGVEKWVNAYRSGDYVGRSLWLNEWYKRTTTCEENGIYPEEIYKAAANDRVEFCIGAGAHTHYWDDTAPDIASALNRLL